MLDQVVAQTISEPTPPPQTYVEQTANPPKWKKEVTVPDVQKMEFDVNSQMTLEKMVLTAKQQGMLWLEVPAELLVLAHPNKVYPPEGYVVYRDVKVCETGRSEELAEKDGETSYDKSLRLG